MRTFLHGRTETIRGLTPESFEFVKAMDSPKVSLEDKVCVLLSWVKPHCTGNTQPHHRLNFVASV